MNEAVDPKYPLMGPSQARRLAEVKEAFDAIARELPRLAAKTEVKELNERVAKLETLMGQPCLRIGMLGSSGAGKSTTVSNILGVPERDGPCPPGGGGAGTAVATRIRASAPGGSVKLRLEFMTREQYNARLAEVQGLIPGLGDASPGDLPGLIRKAAADGLARPEELRSLSNLLEAFQAHSARLGTVDESHAYEDRSRVLLHAGAGAGVSFIPLLRQVVVDFPFASDRVDHRLELIDLPGLGVSNRADERLTESFLGELNGAFVFLRAKGANDEQAAKLIEKLLKQFPRLGGRVWALVSGFDSLDAPMLGEAPGARSVLDYLADYLTDRGVNHRNAILLGNHIYQGWLREINAKSGPTETPSRITAEMIARWSREMNLVINLPRGVDGEPIVPRRFREHPILADAFEKSVLVDGGIGRLREVITRDVFDAVVREVRGQVDDGLEAAAAAMADELSAALARSGMDPNDLVLATQWRSKLLELGRRKLQRERRFYETEAKKLNDDLDNYLDQAIVDDLPIKDPDRPAVNMLDLMHQIHCRNLRVKVLDAAPELLRDIYKRVDDEIAGVSLGPIETAPPPLRDPKAAWTARTTADRRDPTWYTPTLNSFHNELVFVRDLEEASSTYPKDDYKRLMKHKTQAVVREFIRLTLDRMAGHLKGLGDELLLIGGSPAEADPVAESRYKALIDRLGKAPRTAQNGAI